MLAVKYDQYQYASGIRRCIHTLLFTPLIFKRIFALRFKPYPACPLAKSACLVSIHCSISKPRDALAQLLERRRYMELKHSEHISDYPQIQPRHWNSKSLYASRYSVHTVVPACFRP